MGKSRAQVARELPPSPQGTTASTTPPFRRVVCVINVRRVRLRQQRHCSAGSSASSTRSFRRVRLRQQRHRSAGSTA